MTKIVAIVFKHLLLSPPVVWETTDKHTHTVMIYYNSHQVLISLANWCSPISSRALLSTDHDGIALVSPFRETLSCCCSHAASISIIQSLMSPCCSFLILFSVAIKTGLIHCVGVFSVLCCRRCDGFTSVIRYLCVHVCDQWLKKEQHGAQLWCATQCWEE